jgi:hypothetical protein
MRSLVAAIGPRVARGLIELHPSFAGSGIVGHLLWAAATLVAMFLLRDERFEGMATHPLGGACQPLAGDCVYERGHPDLGGTTRRQRPCGPDGEPRDAPRSRSTACLSSGLPSTIRA